MSLVTSRAMRGRRVLVTLIASSALLGTAAEALAAPTTLASAPADAP
ncbi:MAG TPA: hypothetical protein VHJ37_01925 [Thermoleophilaceae bacterium]|jgi:hypothetical protein|nr:hypothetical protein [Thermoleophilaceae bacterium]